MLKAISRYGVRMPEGAEKIVEGCYRRGQLVEGPDIAAFERAFAERLGGGTAVGTSYGRMAFFLLLKALDLPAGSEIVIPALTFWVIPELARVAGLRPVFADIDPNTFTLDPEAFERAIGPQTGAVVPTHLFGLPCDMDPIMALARRHKLAVIEDCAHALGATYKGQPVGTFGDGALFSFQAIKPLNALGGGLAFMTDRILAARVATLACAQRWPTPGRVGKRVLSGWFHRLFTRPGTFTYSQFPILWTASWFDANPDVYFWEPIQRLDRFPDDYPERFANVHAALALAGLERLGDWTAKAQAHARMMNDLLGDLPGVQTPFVPGDRRHVFYQYCVYTPSRDDIVKRCIRRGVDLETLHVDICSSLPLFTRFVPSDVEGRSAAPNAERTAQLIQAPIHSSLTDAEVERVGRTIRDAVLQITREVETHIPAERSA